MRRTVAIAQLDVQIAAITALNFRAPSANLPSAAAGSSAGTRRARQSSRLVKVTGCPIRALNPCAGHGHRPRTRSNGFERSEPFPASSGPLLGAPRPYPPTSRSWRTVAAVRPAVTRNDLDREVRSSPPGAAVDGHGIELARASPSTARARPEFEQPCSSPNSTIFPEYGFRVGGRVS